jgi:tyrosinase
MKVVMRRNQNTLDDTEKFEFVQAVRALKDNGTYDELFVKVHRDTLHPDNTTDDAHRGPAFFPWHREFLLRLEKAMQDITPTGELLALPYWDWSVDNSPNSSIWASSGWMGGDGQPGDHQVPKGGFAFKNGWTLKYILPPEETTYYLKRQLGGDPVARTLPTPQNVTDTLNQTAYDVYPWNINSASGLRNMAEGWINGPQMHNRVHMWVGGSMVPMTSPNDPIFFLHHCFVDKLWADWQRLHQDDKGHKDYLPPNGAAPGHNLNDALRPWDQEDDPPTPAKVLDHRALGYRYDTEDYLLPNEELYTTQWILSADGTYKLLYDTRGRLWFSRKDAPGHYIWTSKSRFIAPPSPCRCILRPDGNLVSYDPDGRVIWDSQTARDPNPSSCYLLVNGNNGLVELYHDGNVVWNTAKG